VTRRERLVAKILGRPPEMDFDDVRWLLEEYGWEYRRERGSHVTFKKRGTGTVTIPKRRGRVVARPSIDMVIAKLGLENDSDDN
jgi:predicted RNA binding protein YcfA (HicA-like mRNA interferase family)